MRHIFAQIRLIMLGQKIPIKLIYFFYYISIAQVPPKMQQVKDINVTSQEVVLSFLLKQEMMTRQLCARQDHTAMGSYINSNGVNIHWGAAFDGHGDSSCIDTIRRADLDEIMKHETPHIELQRLIEADCKSLPPMKRYGTGATFIYVKVITTVLSTEIKITNIGDSRAILFVNDEPVFVSEPHDYDSGKEMVRLMKEKRVDERFPLIKQASNFDMITPTRLVSKRGTYINFVTPDEDRMSLSTSQSLGHMGLCGFAPETTTYVIKSLDTFKIFLFSDGISDVIPVDGFMCTSSVGFYQQAKTANEIVAEAERRWKQDWSFNPSLDFRTGGKTKFPANGYDDCCCVMLEKAPIVEALCCIENINTDEDVPKIPAVVEEDDLYA